MKIYVGQPVYGYVPGEASINFSRMLLRESQRGLVGGVVQVTTNPLGRARCHIVEAALEGHATHIFFVDSDMILPPDALPKLLARDVPVVTGLYYGRVAPHWPVVSKEFSQPLRPFVDYGSGLSKVWGGGLGCALIKARVFTDMAVHYGNKDWFDFGGNDGEDVWFHQRCAALDIPCFLDADVKCGHVTNTMITEGDFKRRTATLEPDAAARGSLSEQVFNEFDEGRLSG